MKKTIRLSLALLSLIFAVSPMASAAEKAKVKVGMSGTYFPFTFQKLGKLQGFEVDVWNEIGKRNNYDVEFVTANFSGLFGLLESGRIDTISNQISANETRKKKYLFSDPYVIDGVQITVKKDNDTIHGVEDLAGKTVAVNLGSNFEQALREYDKDNKINIKTYDTGIEQDVVLGRSDAFVMDRLSTIQLIKKAKLPLKLAGEPFKVSKNAWPFVKNAKGEKLQKQVNATLKEMRSDGSLAKISEKWFDTDVTKLPAKTAN